MYSDQDVTYSMIALILVVFAFVLAVLATFNVPSRFNLIAASLAFFYLYILIGGAFGAHLIK